jgi:myo-inositol-1(or 4)-monophosphatase
MNYLNFAEKALTKAASVLELATAEILRTENNSREVKLNIDLKLNEIIINELLPSKLPILSEEEKKQHIALEDCWIIDPLDGSLNFLRGIPYCAISIALFRNSVPVAAFVYDFLNKTLTQCVKGHGLKIKDIKQKVSDITQLNEAIICSGFPSRMDYSTENLLQYTSMAQKFRKVRMFGSALQSLLHLASGKVDAYFEKDIMLWDIAAGILLVEEAGGMCTMLPGSQPNSKIFLATNKLIHNQAKEIFL